jgi:cold shock CspA family protein
MEKGQVKWFNPIEGFGFIETNNYRPLFFYHKDVENCALFFLRESEQVAFEIEERIQGPLAVKVKRLQ